MECNVESSVECSVECGELRGLQSGAGLES